MFFIAHKNVAFFVFVRLYAFFVIFVRVKSFREKKKNCLNALIYITSLIFYQFQHLCSYKFFAMAVPTVHGFYISNSSC